MPVHTRRILLTSIALVTLLVDHGVSRQGQDPAVVTDLPHQRVGVHKQALRHSVQKGPRDNAKNVKAVKLRSLYTVNFLRQTTA